jgi:hypothetical protein
LVRQAVLVVVHVHRDHLQEVWVTSIKMVLLFSLKVTMEVPLLEIILAVVVVLAEQEE